MMMRVVATACHQAGEDEGGGAGVDEAGGGMRSAKRRKRAWEEDSGDEGDGPNSEDEAEVRLSAQPRVQFGASMHGAGASGGHTCSPACQQHSSACVCWGLLPRLPWLLGLLRAHCSDPLSLKR